MRAVHRVIAVAAGAALLLGGDALPGRWWDSAAGGIGTPVYGRTLWVASPAPDVALECIAGQIGWWRPDSPLADVCSGDAGSIGGAALVAESGVASGYAIQSDGAGGATLPSVSVDDWRTDDPLTVCAWVDWPAAPSGFHVIASTQPAAGHAPGWSLRNGGPGRRERVRLGVSDGLVSVPPDTATAAWESGAQHLCASYNPAEKNTCYWSDGALGGCVNFSVNTLGAVAAAEDVHVAARADGAGTMPVGSAVACIEVHAAVLNSAGVAAARARCLP
jgi:hypothetical protein